MESEAEARAMKKLAHPDFGLGIAAFDTTHHLTSGTLIDYVHGCLLDFEIG